MAKKKRTIKQVGKRNYEKEYDQLHKDVSQAIIKTFGRKAVERAFAKKELWTSPWQEKVLLSPSKRINILASRRVGKSFSSPAKALVQSIQDEHLDRNLSRWLWIFSRGV
jgi:hypothetical protein